MNMNSPYRNELHLKVANGMVELWGGPVYTRGANLSRDEQEEFDAWTRIINWGEQLRGDEGPIFRHEVVFAGLPVWALHRHGSEAHFELLDGNWVVVEAQGLLLALEARDVGLPVRDYTTDGGVPILGLRLIPQTVFTFESE